MNDLSEVDRGLLQTLREKIQQKAGLTERAALTQKDFDFLLYYVQDKTGQALSLTTLKRIWRDEYQRLPHLSTLNMLAQMACGKDWHTAKKEFVEQQDREHRQPVLSTPVGSSRRSGILQVAVSIATIVTMLGGVFLYLVIHTRTTPGASMVTFSAQPTTDNNIPNSVVFSYDITGVKADHFYIQQSWDSSRKVEISGSNTRQTDIYYEPGYHYAKLLSNTTVLKEIPVHIRYNAWFVRFRFPNGELLRVDPSGLDTVGHLGLKPDYLRQLSKPLSTPFQLGYMLSRDFNLSADAVDLEAAVRFDSPHAPPCPLVNVLIKGDEDYAWITLGNRGCESNLGLKVGDKNIVGKTNDLSALGMDAFSWQKIKIKIQNDTLKLFFNNKAVYETAYTKKLGQLKEVDFFFNGIGSIDEIRLADAADQAVLSQSF